MFKYLIKPSIGYAFVLTIFSLVRMYVNTLENQLLNSLLAFAIIAIIYVFLSIQLKKYHTGQQSSIANLILIGTLITIIGCTLSTTVMGIYNEVSGITNNLFNSFRAIVVNGIIGLVLSTIISLKLRKNKKSLK